MVLVGDFKKARLGFAFLRTADRSPRADIWLGGVDLRLLLRIDEAFVAEAA